MLNRACDRKQPSGSMLSRGVSSEVGLKWHLAQNGELGVMQSSSPLFCNADNRAEERQQLEKRQLEALAFLPSGRHIWIASFCSASDVRSVARRSAGNCSLHMLKAQPCVLKWRRAVRTSTRFKLFVLDGAATLGTLLFVNSCPSALQG